MSSRSARMELRAEPAREQRIRYAATLTRQSVSAFVLDAAARAAEDVIAAARTTIVPTDFFDRLWRALDRAPRPNPRLRRRSQAKRRVVQRP